MIRSPACLMLGTSRLARKATCSSTSLPRKVANQAHHVERSASFTHPGMCSCTSPIIAYQHNCSTLPCHYSQSHLQARRMCKNSIRSGNNGDNLENPLFICSQLGLKVQKMHALGPLCPLDQLVSDDRARLRPSLQAPLDAAQSLGALAILPSPVLTLELA